MMDSRVEKLAQNLVSFSTKVQPGDNVLIEAGNGCEMLVKALIREVYKAGGRPFVWMKQTEIERELAKGYSPEQLELRAAADYQLMDKMQVYIGFSAPVNSVEMSDIPSEKMTCIQVYIATGCMARFVYPRLAGAYCATPRQPWHRRQA